MNTLQYIAIHDGFQPLTIWNNFLQGSDRIMLDQHPYFSSGGPQPDPIAVPGENGEPGGKWPRLACDSWASGTNRRFVLSIHEVFPCSLIFPEPEKLWRHIRGRVCGLAERLWTLSTRSQLDCHECRLPNIQRLGEFQLDDERGTVELCTGQF